MRVSCPTCDEHPVRRNPFQGFLQRGSNKRIVQRLVDHNIVGVTAQFRQKRPPFRMPLKAVSRFAAVSNPDDLAGLLTHHGCQQIDTLNHPLQIVLRFIIEQADLHIHHNNCIHGLFPQFNQTPFEN